MKKYPVVIGRFEHIDIVPHLEGIPAKIDTGAYRSAVHASEVSIVEKNGKERLRFTLGGHSSYKRKRTLYARSYQLIEVTSSSGHKIKRYEVLLKIRMGYKIFNTSFTLADRQHQAFPILVGRKALRNRFIVDVSRSGVSRQELKQTTDKLIARGDQEFIEELEK